MNDNEKEIERLKLSVKGVEESLAKLQTCATVMKELVEKFSKVDIDKLIEEKLKESDKHE